MQRARAARCVQVAGCSLVAAHSRCACGVGLGVLETYLWHSSWSAERLRSPRVRVGSAVQRIVPVRLPSAFRVAPARQRVLAARGCVSVRWANGAPQNPCHAIVHTVFFSHLTAWSVLYRVYGLE